MAALVKTNSLKYLINFVPFYVLSIDIAKMIDFTSNKNMNRPVCQFFQKPGGCKFGNRCKNQHQPTNVAGFGGPSGGSFGEITLVPASASSWSTAQQAASFGTGGFATWPASQQPQVGQPSQQPFSQVSVSELREEVKRGLWPLCVFEGEGMSMEEFRIGSKDVAAFVDRRAETLGIGLEEFKKTNGYYPTFVSRDPFTVISEELLASL
jgi:hypothetical protein